VLRVQTFLAITKYDFLNFLSCFFYQEASACCNGRLIVSTTVRCQLNSGTSYFYHYFYFQIAQGLPYTSLQPASRHCLPSFFDHMARECQQLPAYTLSAPCSLSLSLSICDLFFCVFQFTSCIANNTRNLDITYP
jgi:hypothetical protein